MKSFNGITKIVVLLILLLAVSPEFSACRAWQPWEPGVTITVHNQTDQTIQIFLDGEVFMGEAVPGGEVTFPQGVTGLGLEFIAKDTEGNVVYTANFTYDDVKGKKTLDVYFPPESESSVTPSDSAITIIVDNKTWETIKIFYNGVYIGKVIHHVELSWKADGTLPQYIVTAKDMSENTVYAKTFTREELIRNKWLVVIPSQTEKGMEHSDNTTEK